MRVSPASNKKKNAASIPMLEGLGRIAADNELTLTSSNCTLKYHIIIPWMK
jgi:hypothetical protein